MPPAISAGLLAYRQLSGLEVLLIHPGGPFWANKDAGAWSIPKGTLDPDEEALAAAVREFTEETGFTAAGPFRPLKPVRQRSGKIVHAWAVEFDCDPAHACSNSFAMEWPPRSGRMQEFPEVDRAAWFSLPEARTRLLAAQLPFLDQLEQLLANHPSPA